MDTEVLGPVRRVVVAAASRHGGTREIADRIAQTLTATLPSTWQVMRDDLVDLRVLDDADAVVLGSAVYYGRWLHTATRALEYLHEVDLDDLWLFSTGPVSEDESENAEVISADLMASVEGTEGHMVFGGVLDTSHLNLLERLVVRAVHALPGDHRDWAEVDAWARGISAQLTSP